MLTCTGLVRGGMHHSQHRRMSMSHEVADDVRVTGQDIEKRLALFPVEDVPDRVMRKHDHDIRRLDLRLFITTVENAAKPSLLITGKGAVRADVRDRIEND